MSRPEMRGLKYFPFDAGFFGDRKIRLLRGEHGADGVEVYQRLLCKTYGDNGYYLVWDNEEDYALLANEAGYPEDKIRLIVSSCLRRSLFDDTLFKVGNVLTSRGIQRRYFSAVKDTKIKAAAQGRYTTICEDLCLLTEEDFSEFNNTRVWLKVGKKYSLSGINSDKSGINSDKSPINPPNETKGNEMKGNETRGEQSTGTNPAAISSKNAYDFYRDKINPSPGETVYLGISEFAEYFGDYEVLITAFQKAIDAGKANWSYIRGILNSWKASGIRTIADVRREETEWEQKKTAVKGNKAKKPGTAAAYESPKVSAEELKRKKNLLEKLKGESDE